MRRFVIFGATATLLAAVALLPAPARADFLYHVQMDTSSLIGHPAAPFSLDFQLIDGDGVANNTVTLTNFAFGGGAPSGAAVLFGGASGDLSGTVTLTDSGFLNEFVQSLAPGNVLAFDLATTSGFVGGIPDGFSFAVLDSTGSELPTLDPAGAFLQVDFGGGAPAVQAFASDSSQAPAGGGGPLSIPAPSVQSSVAPEPATASLLAFLALPWGARRLRRI